MTKIENWEKELPILKENSEKAVALRTDGHDFDSDVVLPEDTVTAAEAASANDGNADDDEDDDVEFEQV